MENQEVNGETSVPEIDVEAPADNSGAVDAPVMEGQGDFASDAGTVVEGSEGPQELQEGQETPETGEIPSEPENQPEEPQSAPEEIEQEEETESGGTLEPTEQSEGGADEPPRVEYSLENPMPVTIIEPKEEEQQLEVFSLSGSYNGTISDTYLDYFRGIVQKLDWNEHYVVYRSGEYSYTMVYGEEVGLNGDEFTGSGNVVTIYRSSSSYDRDWYVSYREDTLALDSSDLFVYSDLGMYPTLKEGGSALEATTLLFAVGFAIVYSVCHDIFDYIMEHVYRK